MSAEVKTPQPSKPTVTIDRLSARGFALILLILLRQFIEQNDSRKKETKA